MDELKIEEIKKYGKLLNEQTTPYTDYNIFEYGEEDETIDDGI